MAVLHCTRKLEFDAAHRVMRHESKCHYLHGHRYVVEACFTGDALDPQGRLIDFGVIKARLGPWLDTNWDHNTILHQEDDALGGWLLEHLGQHVFYLPANPTAEVLAAYLLETVCPPLFADTPVRCTHVRLWETPNCYADAGLEASALTSRS